MRRWCYDNSSAHFGGDDDKWYDDNDGDGDDISVEDGDSVIECMMSMMMMHL